jgi:hypothetical protein
MSGSVREPFPPLVARHLVVGWSLLLVYVVLGSVLEVLHGFKVGWYVDAGSSTRRLMWTLAHAHGVLLGLVNVAVAATAVIQPRTTPRAAQASIVLVAASLLLPTGFLLGGIGIHGGDPGLGILLTPAGGALLVLALVLALICVRAR